MMIHTVLCDFYHQRFWVGSTWIRKFLHFKPLLALTELEDRSSVDDEQNLARWWFPSRLIDNHKMMAKKGFIKPTWTSAIKARLLRIHFGWHATISCTHSAANEISLSSSAFSRHQPTFWKLIRFQMSTGHNRVLSTSYHLPFSH